MIALAGLVGFLCYLRLYFGVDLTDESFYAAVPYEYVLGNRPYVDELNAGVSFGLLTYPLVRAYGAVASPDGLVLALRHAYFALTAGGALLALLLLRRVVAWPWLLVGGLGCLSLVPFSLPALSYNTIAAGLLVYGFVFGLNYFLVSRAKLLLCLAGFCHGLAAVAYPPLLLVIPVYAIVLCVLRPSTRARAVVAYGLGALVVPSLWGVTILIIGPHHVSQGFSFTRDTAAIAGGWAKLAGVLLAGPVHWAANVGPATLLAIVAIAAGRKRGGLRRWCIALIPVAGLGLVATGTSSTSWSVQYVILLALYSWLVAWHDLEPSDTRRCLVLWGLVPALCAGAVTAYSSTNGFMAAWVGLAPAVLISCVATGLAAEASAALPERAHATRGGIVAVVAVLVAGLFFQWVAVYRDAPVPQLTAFVPSGPYHGLFTTPERRAMVLGLAADIDAKATPADRILFLQNAPGGYLLSAVRPAGPSIWLRGADTNPVVHAWYAATGRAPTICVSFRTTADAPVQRQLNLWGSPYDAVLVRDAYVIYRRAHPTRSGG